MQSLGLTCASFTDSCFVFVSLGNSAYILSKKKSLGWNTAVKFCLTDLNKLPFDSQTETF